MVRYPVSMVVFALGFVSFVLAGAMHLPVRVPIERYAFSEKISALQDDLEAVRTVITVPRFTGSQPDRDATRDVFTRATATVGSFGRLVPVSPETEALAREVREIVARLEGLVVFGKDPGVSHEPADSPETMLQEALVSVRAMKEAEARIAREAIESERSNSRFLLFVWGGIVLLAGAGSMRIERRLHAERNRMELDYIRMQRTVRELSMLSEMMGYINSEVEPDRILESMVVRAQELVRSEAGLILLVDPLRKDISRFVSTAPVSQQLSEVWLRSGIFDEVLDGSAPVRIARSEEDRLSACPRGTRNLISVPLISENQVHGVMALLNKREGDFLQEDEDTLINYAFHAYQAIHLHAEITRMATTDGLTGLFNHRVFQERLKTEVARHVRYSRSPLSLLMVDIDHFKSINDNHGHQAGDKVLKGIAATLDRMIRGIVDVAARYGGEEFVIILPETRASDAMIVSERIREKIARDGFISDDGDRIEVTVSIGMANCPDDARDKDDLIRCADTALYWAKKNGRNRSARYESSMLT